MSTFSGKLHAVGYVPATQGILYQAPALTTSYVKKLYLNNKYNAGDMGATVETVQIFIRKSGGSVVRKRRFVFQPGWSGELDHIVLEAGDSLEGVSTNASTTSFVIDGANEA